MNPARRFLLATAKRVWPVLSRYETWQRPAVTVVTVILVLALAHSLARLTMTVLSGQSSPVGTPAPVQSSADRASGIQPDAVAAIVGWHLFGRVETGQPPPPVPAAIPVTPRNLRLAGVFFAERNNQHALALIAEGGGLERGYRVGESLPGGARLERIQRDHVLVSRNNRQEALYLPKLDESGRISAPLMVPAATEPASSPAAAVQIIDASAVASRLRSEMATRPQALEDIAFASPYLQDGQFVGFRLRPGRDRQLFQQLGLNGGDVLTEINGTRLNSPAQGLMLLQELMSATRIDVRLLRNGVEAPLTFSLDGSAPAERD